MSTLLNRPTTKFLDDNGYVSHEWNLWLMNPNVQSINTSGLSLGTSSIGIQNGGTGQATPTAAFNALSPITSPGDLIVGNGPNSAVRLPVGSRGSILTTDGTSISWGQPIISASISLDISRAVATLRV